MTNYYAYCSSNHVYNALISNSVQCNALSLKQLISTGVSFYGNNFVFVTKLRFNSEIRNISTAADCFPVTIEFDYLENTGVLAVFVTEDEDGGYHLSDKFEELATYDDHPNCIGALLFGQIPFSFVTGLFFENEEYKTRFYKSSDDLWFPEHLYHIWDFNDEDRYLDIQTFSEICKKADSILDENVANNILSLLEKSLRIKAALYYAVKETSEWQVDGNAVNFDEALIRVLDQSNKGRLYKLVNKKIADYQKKLPFLKYEDIVSTDTVLNKSSNINSKLFYKISEFLVTIPSYEDVSRSYDKLEALCDSCEELDEVKNLFEEPKLRQELSSVLQYFQKKETQFTSPKEVLDSISEYTVLKSLLVFLDNQRSSDYVKNGCKRLKLSQKETRYALLFYALQKGMPEVVGEYKSNLELESRLEEISAKIIKIDKPYCVLAAVPNNASPQAAYGVVPTIILRDYSKEIEDTIMTCDNTKYLESIYKQYLSGDINPSDVFSFKVPKRITVSSDDGNNIEYKAETMSEAANTIAALKDLFEQAPKEFNVNHFKCAFSSINKYDLQKKLFDEDNK